MVEKIKYVYRLGQCTIFEHDKFFNYMRHRFKWSKYHENGNYDKNWIWNFIKNSPHNLLSWLSIDSYERRLCAIFQVNKYLSRKEIVTAGFIVKWLKLTKAFFLITLQVLIHDSILKIKKTYRPIRIQGVEQW